MDDIIVYHGSRGGLDGPIQPSSRTRCDFGKGFYMGEHPEQVIDLVADDPAPVFYTLKLKLSEIPEDRILFLEDQDWLYTVLACRNRVKKFSELQIAKDAIEKLQQYDVIIGVIGDDRMNVAMTAFSNNGISDAGLQACLQYVDYGLQFVARTEFACSKIEVISERDINIEEINQIREYKNKQRIEDVEFVQNMAQKYRRDGLLLGEIIDNENQKEQLQLSETDYDDIGDNDGFEQDDE